MKFRNSIFLIGLLATGCVRFQSQPISPARTAAELESRSLTNAPLKTFLEKNLQRELTDWPATPWNFQMLTLAAFYYHPDLALARAQWAVAKAGIETAGGRPNPTLSLTPGYNTTHALPSPWFPAVNFDLPLETAGKRRHRIDAAHHASESARLNISTVAWQIRSSLRSTLLDLLAARERETWLRKQISLEEQNIQLLEQQAQAGAIARSEPVLPRIALQKLRLDFSDAQRQRVEARVRVAEALGIPLRALEDVNLSADLLNNLNLPGDFTTTEMRRTALLSRTDILGALANYAAAQAGLQTEIAKQYPDVHLNPGYQFDQGENKWSLGITFELPLLNQNQGPIAEAIARRAEAAARFQSVQAKALGEIERATVVFQTSRESAATLRALATAQRQQRDSIEAQFQVGALDRREWVNAQFEFAGAQILQLDGEFKLRQAAAQLEDAVQQPLEILSAAALNSAASGKLEQP